jgi:peroxiredoxin
MLPLGTAAPSFTLADVDGKLISLKDFSDKPALLVIFMCNHCPYVKHVLDGMLRLINEYQQRNVAVVTINSNDIAAFPEDRPEMMAKIARQKNFTFPYLFDETQDVAKAYKAACTPDFYLFDSERKLVYRGQMDESRPGNSIPVTGNELRAALDALLAGKPVNQNQKPSIGCNIKWKPANEPAYTK